VVLCDWVGRGRVGWAKAGGVGQGGAGWGRLGSGGEWEKVIRHGHSTWSFNVDVLVATSVMTATGDDDDGGKVAGPTMGESTAALNCLATMFS
jgi:hypothetical protein